MLATIEAPRCYCLRGSRPTVYLSEVEFQVARGFLARKFIAQIAADIGISERSVDYHCYRMMKLTGCRDFFELLACLRSSNIGS